jgi:hypothetical protein
MIKKPTDISKLLAILLVVMLLLSSSNIVFAQNITAANAVNNNISNTELDNYKILNEVYQNYKKGIYTTEFYTSSIPHNDLAITLGESFGMLSYYATLHSIILNHVDFSLSDAQKIKIHVNWNHYESAKRGYNEADHEVVKEIYKKEMLKYKDRNYIEKFNTLHQVANNIIKEALKYGTVREQLFYINRYLAVNCRYDYDILLGKKPTLNSYFELDQSYEAYGCLVDNKAVCLGYAKAVQLLCEKLNVPSIIVSGVPKKDEESPGHAWNLVYVDGEWLIWDATNYYIEGITMDGPLDEGKYRWLTHYFLVSNSNYHNSFKLDQHCEKHLPYIKTIACPESSTIDLENISIKLTKTQLKKYHVQKELELERRKANGEAAKPTTSNIILNGKEVKFAAYNMQGHNYFKLRDLACAINGTNKQFEVLWDQQKNSINILTGSAYTPVGGELSGYRTENIDYVTILSPTSILDNFKSNEIEYAELTLSKLYVDDRLMSFKAYNIRDNNYFKLRDIAKVIGFGVEWDGKNNMIIIDTNKSYEN